MTNIGLRVVDEPEGQPRLVWADPETIQGNPSNPKIHPVEQTDAVEAFISELGWLQYLVYNLESGHLVDGHDRLDTAVREGWPAVPVVVGRWSADQEDKIVLALSETGRLAEWQPYWTRRLCERLSTSSGVSAKLAADLSARELLGPLIAKAKAAQEETREPRTETTEPGADPRTVELAKQPEVLSASRVRLVHLFLDTERLERFRAWDEVLQEHLGVENTTDVVMCVMESAYCSALRGGIGRRR